MSDSLSRTPSEDAETREGRAPGQLLTHIFFILFCLEIGLVLLLLPWTLFWDNNSLLRLAPHWADLWSSTSLRGAISGIGVLNLWIGVSEIRGLWR
jgi:hypothetical protein